MLEIAAQAGSLGLVTDDVEPDQGVDHAVGLPADNADQRLQQAIPRIRVEASDHAEVVGDDAPVGEHREVAGVRIGVEEAVHEDRVEHEAGCTLGEG